MNFLPEEREAYEDHLKWLRIEANMLKKYQAIGFDEGKAEGLEEGNAKGVVEGINRGVQKVAKALLVDGMSVAKVSDLTGLTVEEVEALAEK